MQIPGDARRCARLLARAYPWLGMLQAAVAMSAFFFVLQAGGWNEAFGTLPLSAEPWLLMILLALSIGALEELRKLLARFFIARSGTPD